MIALTESAERTGVVDVGGGLRDIFSAGVLDYCLDNGISFDVGIGVSAGSANLASFTARQRGRNFVFYTEYAFRKQYMSMENFLREHSYIDLDYIYGALSNDDGENPLDYQALRENPMEFEVVCTNALTGEAHYFSKEDLHQNSYEPLKASSAIPFVCKPQVIGGVPYYDGALGDPIPIRRALSLGCTKTVLLLSKPLSEKRTSKKDKLPAKMIEKAYPRAAEQLLARARRYNEDVALAQAFERQGRMLVVAPDDTCGVDTLKKDRDALEELYQKGYSQGPKVAEFLGATS